MDDGKKLDRVKADVPGPGYLLCPTITVVGGPWHGNKISMFVGLSYSCTAREPEPEDNRTWRQKPPLL